MSHEKYKIRMVGRDNATKEEVMEVFSKILDVFSRGGKSTHQDYKEPKRNHHEK